SGPGAQASKKDLRLDFDSTDLPESDDDQEEDQGKPSKGLKLFDNPLFNSQALSDYMRKTFGMSRSPGEGSPGAETQVRTIRRASSAGANARPLPTPLRISSDSGDGAAAGVGGSLFPEWDVYKQQYRAEWCRVINFPL